MQTLHECLKFPLFGAADRLEKIVSWSQQNPTGSRLTKVRAVGLSFELVARQNEPQIYIDFRACDFHKALTDVTNHASLIIDGFTFRLANRELQVRLPSLPRGQTVLWRGEPGKSGNFSQRLGMIELSESGLKFYQPRECLGMTEIIKPLSVSGEAMSLRNQRFLVRDALVNSLLKQNYG